MNEILLSIVIPVYNSPLIGDTLSSLKNYKNDKIELIVVDGGSEDDTLDRIKEYTDIVDVLVSEPDEGPYDAANKGIKIAKGSWIFWLSAGDTLLADPVEIINKYDTSNIDVICGSIMEEKKNGEYKIVLSEKNLQKLDYHCSLRQPASFFRKTVLQTINGYDTQYKYASDRDLFIRIRDGKYKILIIPDVVTSFRYGGLTTLLRALDSYEEDYDISVRNGMNRFLSFVYYALRCVKYKIFNR